MATQGIWTPIYLLECNAKGQILIDKAIVGLRIRRSLWAGQAALSLRFWLLVRSGLDFNLVTPPDDVTVGQRGRITRSWDCNMN